MSLSLVSSRPLACLSPQAMSSRARAFKSLVGRGRFASPDARLGRLQPDAANPQGYARCVGQTLLTRGAGSTAAFAMGASGQSAQANAACVETSPDAAPMSPAVAAVAAIKPGQKFADGAFEVLSVEEVPEYSVAAVEMVHSKTGARWLHVGADDPNNVFNVAFRTTPTDDTGVAHILEHTALCGSEKYPIRDPFFNMLRRSLSTFMNAMTAADFTCYPFATMNTTDYYNLLGVYLDAAFFPKLTREDFLQEGHRLEFENMEDPASELMIKGVVFNEMKGAMGSQSARFGRALGSALFPSSTYHHNSGGDPVSIPSLTYEQLKQFHATHYHPSNARFFTYGDLPLEQTLEKAQELALGRFDPIDVSSLEVSDEVRLAEPKRVEVAMPSEAVVPDPEKQSVVSIAYLLVNQIKDPDAELESFALTVAGDLLLSGPQAYFHESLIESGLGSGFSPGTGYGGSRRETSFAVGLKGIAADDVKKVEDLVQGTFEKIAQEGFPRERVDAVMHQVELGASRVSTNFGLGVAFGAMSTWVHGGDGLRSLRTPALARKLQEALDADPEFWQKLIQSRFLDNPHKVVVVGHSDDDYDKRLEEEEQARVKEIAAKLTEEEKSTIVKDAIDLRSSQDSEQDPSVLPTLVVSEAVPKEIKRWGSQEGTAHGGVPLQMDEQPTNGITYATVMLDCSGLPDRLVPYLDLFADFLTELGTAVRDYKEFAQVEKATTGGVGASVSATPAVDGVSAPEISLVVSAHALDRNVTAMFDLIAEAMAGARWSGESQHLGQLLQRRAAAAGAQLGPQGLSFAQSTAAASIQALGELDNRTGGLPHVALLQRLAREKEAGVAEVEAALGEIAGHVLAAPRVMRCRLACQPGAPAAAAQEALDGLLKGLKADATEASPGEATLASALSAFVPAPSRTFVGVPSQTNYCTSSFVTVPYVHEDAAPLYLLSHALSTAFLHREIREKGGAYGGGASASPLSGRFGFTSYRDPNTTQTIATFRSAAEWAAAKGNITAAELEEAHLRAFKSLDAPLAPSSRGSALFSSRLTDDTRQLFRDRLLSCTADKMREVAERYLISGSISPASAIVGGPSAAPSMQEEGWTVLDAEGNPLK